MLIAPSSLGCCMLACMCVLTPPATHMHVCACMLMQMTEVKDESTQVPYSLADDGGNVKIKCPNAGKDFAPEEISAQVLRKLTADAAKFLNDKVRQQCARAYVHMAQG